MNILIFKIRFKISNKKYHILGSRIQKRK